MTSTCAKLIPAFWGSSLTFWFCWTHQWQLQTNDDETSIHRALQTIITNCSVLTAGTSRIRRILLNGPMYTRWRWVHRHRNT